MNRKQKKELRQRQSTRQLMGIVRVTPHGIVTDSGERVFFLIQPDNLSVLSPDVIRGRVRSLTMLLSTQPTLEILALDSRESFQRNKEYYLRRLEEETEPAVRELLERDMAHLDAIQFSSASSRKFVLVLPLDEKAGADESALRQLEKSICDLRQSAMPLNQFTQQVNFLLSALSGAERIFDMMDETEEIDEGKVTLCNVCKNADGTLTECAEITGLYAWKLSSGELVLLKGDVRFHDVVFGYVSEKTVLNGISLFAKPGQKIAFVGSTGAGKTTIVNLINRFYDIQAGQITYDGIDVKDIRKDDLRRSLAMVIQDTHLFTGTIADNIRYGKLDATDEEIREAAKIANAESFISRLPQGYDTMLYGDGSSLSQGQQQLIAIARAAIAKPPVLILDEATSSIDTRTECLIEKGMDAIMEGRTVFVIAHRLSTVRNSNAIMVLEKGEIIERGSHDELLEQKGRYYQLYTGQFELE